MIRHLVLTVLTATPFGVYARAVTDLPTRPCGLAAADERTTRPPPGVTGRVSFHAALIDPVTLQPRRARSIDPDRLVPLASAYKTLVVWGALRDVDAGRLQLERLLPTTAANRSIEGYSPGRNSIATLARRSIVRSENTAADILHLAVGPDRLQDALQALGTCRTTVLMTTKSFWSAQAGLLPEQFPAGRLGQATRAYHGLPLTEKRRVAAQAVHAAGRVDADTLLRRLDGYFTGPAYDPDIDLHVQNSSTPREFSLLLARVFAQGGLSARSHDVLRDIMADGCCRPRTAPFAYRYWGAKAGSGWRLLTLSGFVEMPDGRLLTYLYVNDRSATRHAEDMERQIPAVTRWVAGELEVLLRP